MTPRPLSTMSRYPAAPAPTVGDRKELLSRVPAWRIVEREGIERLERVFHFQSLRDARRFCDRLRGLAAAESRYPAILMEESRVTVTWWTAGIPGVDPSDFAMAAMADQILDQG